jgi:hypothetical protein
LFQLLAAKCRYSHRESALAQTDGPLGDRIDAGRF